MNVQPHEGAAHLNNQVPGMRRRIVLAAARQFNLERRSASARANPARFD
jgi:hypothetical protein